MKKGLNTKVLPLRPSIIDMEHQVWKTPWIQKKTLDLFLRVVIQAYFSTCPIEIRHCQLERNNRLWAICEQIISKESPML